MKISIKAQYPLNGIKINPSDNSFCSHIFYMSALYEASYLSKMQLCLFLFM